MKYTLGFDIGISSVGTATINLANLNLIDMSVRKFNQAKEAKDARLARSSRRTTRRKVWRKNQLIDAFNDFGIISKEEINKYGKDKYLSFYAKDENLIIPNVYTVYHLRKKALTEQISKREILMSLYNILQARGHFLLDNIDFSKDGITFDVFKDKFYQLSENYVAFAANKEQFEKKLLKKIFEGSIGGKDLKSLLKAERFTQDEFSDKCLTAICSIVNGQKIAIGLLYGDEQEKSIYISDLKKQDELNEIQAGLVELFDICRISRILKDGKQFVCDIAAENIDEYERIKREKDEESEKYKEFKNASKKENHVRSYKNLNNSYPNGLYVKEVDAILHNQQKYYPEITDTFIEVCKTIASARIPYYIGPLGKNAKNKWAEINGKMKYSYEYSLKQKYIDEIISIKRWKENMVSHCTYLPDKVALPKGSLLGEIFSIINEINNFNCKDKNNNDYYLTREDKVKIIDELFLKKENVSLENVKDLLQLGDYYSVKGKTTKFNNKITLYKQIEKICDELKINSVMDIFVDKEKIEKIEELILDINLFDEGKLKEKYFAEQYGEEKAKKLSLLKSNGFYSFSKDFIFNTFLNQDHETMLDILFNDNTPDFRNNQQVIISNACDSNGNKIDFFVNKYEKSIGENNNELSIYLLLKDNKPTMPISRSVIRALNETLKIYNEYIKIYGVPERVVIETAGGKDSIKDFTEQNGSTMKHFSKMENLVKHLFKQLLENEKSAILGNKIEEWKEIEQYYKKNKLKIELYIRQDGIDLLTGEAINLDRLNDYEIDHILPRGFGDDSQDDKMLVSKLTNGKKGNRLPIEFLESSDAKEFTTMTVKKYTDIVVALSDMQMISDSKKDRLLLVNQEEAIGFVNQNLVDTRYVISQFISMLNAFNKVNGYDTHIACLNSSFTKLYSKILNIKKNRDFGDQHHALDAACLCIADKCLNEYFPNYDLQKTAFSKKGNYAGFGKYQEFVEELKKINVDDEEKKNNDEKLNIFVKYAFKKAFNQSVYKNGIEAPLIRTIKERKPLISWKVEKNYDGKLFDATMYKPLGEDDKSILSLLGVNNDKRSFSTVYPIAVDFYKINHKNYAIHIPYVIVDPNGKINKEKYIKLIKEHYKAKELLNERADDINLKAYRFRAYKNDIIFDTHNNEPHLFNLGSIANKKLEIVPLNIFAYNDVYEYSKEIRNQIIKVFNLKTKENENGNKFEEIEKEKILNYLCDSLNILNNPKKHKNNLMKLTSEEKYLNDYCEKIAYWTLIANERYAPPTFDKQIKPSPQNDILEGDEDAQYVKIKYNLLGIRSRLNNNGKIIIEGPVGYKNGGYKLIKKEEFRWTINKYVIE